MYLHTLGVTLTEGKIYFANSDFNALFTLELKGKKIEYKTDFQEFAKFKRELFAKQILHAGKIYFIPRNCNKVAVYNLQTGKTTYIEVQDKGAGPIRDAFIEGDTLWMLYAGYPGHIYKINLTNGKCDVLCIDWKEVIAGAGYSEQMMSMQEMQISVFGYAKQIGEKWWMFIERHGHLVIYDWKKRRTESIAFPYFKGKSFTGNIQEKLWLVARNESRVLEYDFVNKTENWIELPEISRIPGDIMRIIEHDQYLLFIKLTGMIAVNKITFSSKSFHFSEKRNLIDYIFIDDRLILFPVSGNGLVVFSLKECCAQEYPFVWEEKLTNESVESFFSGVLCEDTCRLEEFIELAPQKRRIGEQNVGGKVWDVLSKRGGY